MLKKFTAVIELTLRKSTTIIAENADEAKELARQEYNRGFVRHDIDDDYDGLKIIIYDNEKDKRRTPKIHDLDR